METIEEVVFLDALEGWGREVPISFEPRVSQHQATCEQVFGYSD